MYVNDATKPIMDMFGFFDGIQVHNMDNQKHRVLAINLLTGHSINTLFYAMKKGKVYRVPVSSEKPSAYYGIVSRNYPEFQDIDGDGTLELVAHYGFLYDAQ